MFFDVICYVAERIFDVSNEIQATQSRPAHIHNRFTFRVIVGHRAAWGAPFARLASVRTNDLIAFQGRLSDWLARHRTEAGHAPGLLVLGVFATGIYGGYFGAAQGVILIALLGILVTDDLQRLNALKNVLTAVVNGAAAVLFIIAGPVAWAPALLLAAGAVLGGQLGAVLGRRMRSEPLRAAIVVVGLLVAIRLLIA